MTHLDIHVSYQLGSKAAIYEEYTYMYITYAHHVCTQVHVHIHVHDLRAEQAYLVVNVHSPHKHANIAGLVSAPTAFTY